MRVFFTLTNYHSGETEDLVLESDDGVQMGDLPNLLQMDDVAPYKWGVHSARIPTTTNVFQAVRDGDVVSCWLSSWDSDGDELLETGIELTIASGPESGKVWSLGFGEYSLGRGSDSDIPLSADREVSKNHARLRVTPDGLEIHDQNSTNGVFINGGSVTSSRIFRDSTIGVGSSVLTWSSQAGSPAASQVSHRRNVNFSRPPRILIQHDSTSVQFPGKTPERQKSPFPLLAVFAPVAFGAVMVLLQHSLTYLFFIAMSPLMAIANHFSTNRRGKGTYRALKDRYDAEVEEAERTLAETIELEVADLNDSFPGPSALLDAVAFPNPRLWERRSGDDDFLTLRLGMAKRKPKRVIGGNPPDTPEGFSELIDVPATFDLREIGVLGVVGSPTLAQSFTRWLVSQAAALHAPEDLVLTLLTEIDSEDDWSWFRWFPHARPDGFFGVARLGNTDQTIKQLAKELDSLVSSRIDSELTDSNPTSKKGPAHLVILDGSRHIEDIPSLAHVLRAGPAVRVYIICIDNSEQSLPEECRAVATLSSQKDPQVNLRVDRSSAVSSSRADQVSTGWCDEFARFLAPIRLNRTQESGAALPLSVRLLDLLNLEQPDRLEIGRRWTQTGRTTKAIIGEALSGPMIVDISKDGPHGLVAGTTGSGKSELLQTLIASLAIANRPDNMNFVLVDYKGGSAFKDCANLPHTVGMVTDLDGHLTERALASLGAELRRRERLLQQTQTKDIEDYWRATDDTDQQRLARLVLVIDEFASLVEELPSFVEGLVDLARRGRSLGIHLLLATQRPSGVVSPAIKTNTNLRIAMRVTDAADSVDVIDSPLAARIGKEVPGRGYVRAGHERLTEFQAARVGGRRSMLHHANAEARVARWETLGARREGNSEETITTGATDLSDLVSAIVNAARDLTLEPTRSPWLEPLPELLTLDPEWSPPQSASSLSAVFGVEDRPEVQSQVPAYFDIERDGHLLVVGDAGSGRSTFLRTLAASIASRCSARDVHLFGIDCGNGALLPLADLPQCGAVVSRTEIERVDRLITRLLAEVAQRQQILSLGGFSSIVDQRAQATPEDRLPYIVVLLDRWEGFVSEFDVLDAGRLVSSFLHLMKEAPGVGVRVVVAGDRTALSARFAALVESTIALRLNDRSNYSMVGLNSRKLPEQIVPGRGFRGGSGTEIQIALLDEDPSGPAQAAALRAIARETVARDSALEPADLPAPIASLPQILPLSTVLTRPARTDQSLQVLVGVGGDRAEAQWVDLAMYGPGFIIGGPPRSGRSNALLVVARSLLAQDQQILVVTGRTSSLSLLENNPGVMAVMDGRSVTSETLSGVIASSGGPLAVLVDDAELLADAPIAETLSTFVRTARDYGNALILAGATAELASGFRGFAPEARKSKSGLLLCPSSPTDGELVGVRLSRASVFPGPPGRGLLATQAGTMLVQVPIDNLGF